MTTDDQVHIIETMEQYGGSFVKALAKAWRVADPSNRRRLAAAFPEYWEKYEVMSRMRQGNTDEVMSD